MAEGALVDLHTEPWPQYDGATVERCAALLAAGRTFDYGAGPELTSLEEAFRSRHGRTYALAVNSGTSALYLAFLGLGVRPGDDVLVPTFTFPATATPLLLLGARPVLVDSGDGTGNVTAATLEAALTPRTTGLVVTHLFGEPCDMEPIVGLAARRGLFTVEDCSHAHGSHRGGRSVGTWADASIYSVGARKLVSGGMGGILMTDADTVYDVAVLASASQQRSAASVTDPSLRGLAPTGLGGNLRMTPVAAVLAHSHYERLHELVSIKAARADRLVKGLAALPGISAPATTPDACAGARHGVHVAYRPADGRPSRDDVIERLRGQGLRVRGPQTEPLHRSELFTAAAGAHPTAEALAASWISLPSDYLCGPRGDELVDHYLREWTEAWERWS